eukprot:CCRYP_016349-RA/>CCRYP_016349-RA protein AED:0.46 eAED:0.46 QI:0/0/0/1/0/0/2/0/124
MTHVVFVKTTRKTRISDTVYFKHKYLTQRTLTQANAIVQAYRHGQNQHTVHIEAIRKMQEVMEPQHTTIIESPHAPLSRVEKTAPILQRHPRVQDDKAPPTAASTPTIVIPRPQPTTPTPAPIK